MIAQPPSPHPNGPQGQNDPTGGWAVLQNIVAWLVDFFGTPSALARRLKISPAAAKLLREHLSSAEALARRLLFLRAAQVPMPNARPDAPGAGAGKGGGGGRPGFASEDSADWGLSFRIAPAARAQARRGACIAKPEPPSPYNAAPLAERLEALRRVLADPDCFARRLAARLRRSPALIARLAARPRKTAPALARFFASAAEIGASQITAPQVTDTT